MKLYIDTANLGEIEQINEWGILSGVTTNPSLMAKEGEVFEEVIEKITSLVDGPISAEVEEGDAQSMIEEGRKLSSIHPNVVVKIPFGPEGLKAIGALSREGIDTNCTLIFSVNQGLLAMAAGARYISPFVGRLDDIGHRGMELVEDLHQIILEYGFDTEIIAASIRHADHVKEAALAGADIATIPHKVLVQMLKHPLTDQGIASFNADGKEMKRKHE
ncbi:MAG: fructose-6-phosphate aldolase [Tissierellia bacterium]|nr:fructose-6-phosphate aldolase [Tissierellia bacterium]